MDREHLGMSLLAVVASARDAHVVHPARHHRLGGAARLSRDDVPHYITLDKHMSSLRSALLPWLCLHDTEHSVHGLSP